MRLLDFYIELELRVLSLIKVHLDGDLRLQRVEVWGGGVRT